MNRNWKNEEEARKEILDAVADYYYAFKEDKAGFQPGDRIPYAGCGIL